MVLIERFRRLTLFRQLSLAVTLTVGLILLFYAQYEHRQASEHAYAQEIHEATNLAAHIAYSVDIYLRNKDLVLVEQALVAAGVFSEVNAIRVLSKTGQLVMEVERVSDVLEPTYRLGDMNLPKGKAETVDVRDNQIVVWRPLVRAGEINGWINLTLDGLFPQTIAMSHVWITSVFALILLCAILCVMYLVLRPNLSALEDAAEFARTLPVKAGSSLNMEKHSAELDCLEGALQFASDALVEKNNLFEKNTKQLKLRVKQLGCIYMSSKMLSDPALTLENKLSSVVSLLPSSLQNPELAHAKIIYLGEVFQTDAYQECLHSITEALKVGQQYVGMVELGQEHQKGEGPAKFLKEEVDLLRDIAFRINQLLKQEETQASINSMNRELDRRVKERTFELDKARKMAEQASEAKGEFLSSISHEFRTPMNAVMGFADLILEEGSTLSEGQREAIGYISEAGAHMLSLIDNVLHLAQLEKDVIAIKSDWISVAELFSHLQHRLQPVIDAHHINFKLGIHSKLEKVWLDGELFSQAMFNIFHNAIKFNRDGGDVLVDVFLDQDVLEVSVKDTGCGIESQYFERIFDPFYRIPSSFMPDGVGVGLSVARQIVVQMRGSIQVESTVGDGSRFIVLLPVSPEE